MTSNTPPTSDPLAFLVSERPAFVAFVSQKLRSRDAAEELVQEAFAKAVAHVAELRSSETARGWFYGILRNAIVDYHRRSTVADTAHQRIAHEWPTTTSPEDATTSCGCIGGAIEELKSEYREAIAHVVVSEEPLASFAARENLSNNTAAVRVHRARKALAKKVHATCGACAGEGCRDCTCGH